LTKSPLSCCIILAFEKKHHQVLHDQPTNYHADGGQERKKGLILYSLLGCSASAFLAANCLLREYITERVEMT